MKENMNKDEFVKYLRKRGMSVDEFYSLMGSYFNLTSGERFELIQSTHNYQKLKRR